MRKEISIIGLLILLIVVSAPPGFAHGTSLKLDKTTAAPGQELVLKGEGISSNGPIKIMLQGVRDYELGSAQGDQHGRFEKQVMLPGDIPAGDYLVIAEGQNKATAKLKIAAGTPPASGEVKSTLPAGSMEHEQGGMEGMDHAKAGPMEVESRRGNGETVARWGLILVSLILGLTIHGMKRRREVRSITEEPERNV